MPRRRIPFMRRRASIRLPPERPGWRNGIRRRLKISGPKGREGSTPSLGTNTKTMTFLLALIALPGIAAVLLRWSRALLVTARYAIERFVAGQIADSRAQRGDISGMAEAEKIRRQSRDEAMRSLLAVVLWSALLIVPLFLPGTLIIYALLGLLWLEPDRGSAGKVTRT